MALVVKKEADAGDVRDVGSIPGWERSPGGGHSNPLQYSCLDKPMDRGVRQAIVHRESGTKSQVTKSQVQLKRLSTHAHYGMNACIPPKSPVWKP